MNHSLKVLLLTNSIFVFASGLLGPLYALFVGGLNQGAVSVGLSWGVFLISATVFTYVVSRAGDRLKEKEYFIMAGYAVRALVWFSYSLIDSLSALLVLQVILGLGEALGSPTFSALFAEHLDGGKHIAEYSDWEIVSKLVSGVAIILGGFVVAQFGFIVLFHAMAVLAAISFFVLLIQPRSLL